ncbi:hypothetical protein Tco_1273949 [Tanacetum coccineum]
MNTSSGTSGQIPPIPLISILQLWAVIPVVTLRSTLKASDNSGICPLGPLVIVVVVVVVVSSSIIQLPLALVCDLVALILPCFYGGSVLTGIQSSAVLRSPLGKFLSNTVSANSWEWFDCKSSNQYLSTFKAPAMAHCVLQHSLSDRPSRVICYSCDREITDVHAFRCPLGSRPKTTLRVALEFIGLALKIVPVLSAFSLSRHLAAKSTPVYQLRLGVMPCSSDELW